MVQSPRPGQFGGFRVRTRGWSIVGQSKERRLGVARRHAELVLVGDSNNLRSNRAHTWDRSSYSMINGGEVSLLGVCREGRRLLRLQ